MVKNKGWRMDKKGVWLEIFAFTLIVLTSFGAVKVLTQSSHIYVGDSNTKYFYDYKICPEKINTIGESNRVLFDTVQKASEQGYEKFEECIEQ